MSPRWHIASDISIASGWAPACSTLNMNLFLFVSGWLDKDELPPQPLRNLYMFFNLQSDTKVRLSILALKQTCLLRAWTNDPRPHTHCVWRLWDRTPACTGWHRWSRHELSALREDVSQITSTVFCFHVEGSGWATELEIRKTIRLSDFIVAN